ncbi:SDR family oxidoreductase [Pseudomaricurvus alkylphenolicus]|uniref:SDR family oxidoreductase n=1 Tax=Pseudomaricurvus alkylphenolicus TaxID=1306991 RepID=UPI0014245CD5|nr:SDR family oxidoreductase [Pseudomaricurvus alkylphenolicus]NIB40597.1 SDR family oxidoreductase [Pseudomaricurvus alkylphenolicus]
MSEVSTKGNILQRFSLDGKIALVTGSSRGIGLSLARALAEAGALVVLNGRNEEQLGVARRQLHDLGLSMETECFDVTDEVAVEESIQRIESSLGPIDILINNAGMQRRVPLTDVELSTWQEVLNTNLTSAFLVGRTVARGMISRQRGKIINIGSVQSSLARPSIAPYASSKGAMVMLTRSMCAEWSADNIQVNAIAPGYFNTELTRALVDDEEFSRWLCQRTPANRWGRVEELQGMAVMLASEASSFITGQVMYVDGGMTAVV